MTKYGEWKFHAGTENPAPGKRVALWYRRQTIDEAEENGFWDADDGLQWDNSQRFEYAQIVAYRCVLEPEVTEGHVNVYPVGSSGSEHPTREKADRSALFNRQAVVKLIRHDGIPATLELDVLVEGE